MKGKVFAVFPGLGKTTLCSDFYDNSQVLRTKFLDADYHFFKRFLGRKLTSSKRSDSLYRTAIVAFKRLEPKTVILVNHLPGLEGLVDGVILPEFGSDVLEKRFRQRNNLNLLEPGEKEIIRDYDKIVEAWSLWSLRNHVQVERLEADEYVVDSKILKDFIDEFMHYEDHKRR